MARISVAGSRVEDGSVDALMAFYQDEDWKSNGWLGRHSLLSGIRGFRSVFAVERSTLGFALSMILE